MVEDKIPSLLSRRCLLSSLRITFLASRSLTLKKDSLGKPWAEKTSPNPPIYGVVHSNSIIIYDLHVQLWNFQWKKGIRIMKDDTPLLGVCWKDFFSFFLFCGNI